MPLRLFQNPVLRIAAPVNFTSGLLFYLGVFFLPVFFQEVAGRRRHRVGPAAHPVHDRHRRVDDVRRAPGGTHRSLPRLADPGWRRDDGRRVLALTTIGLDTSVVVVAGLGTVVGIGIGFAMQTSILAVQNAVDITDLGMATSTALLARTLGGTIGTPAVRRGARRGRSHAPRHRRRVRRRVPVVFASAVPVGLLRDPVRVAAPAAPPPRRRRRHRRHHRHRHRPALERFGATTRVHVTVTAPESLRWRGSRGGRRRRRSAPRRPSRRGRAACRCRARPRARSASARSRSHCA